MTKINFAGKSQLSSLYKEHIEMFIKSVFPITIEDSDDVSEFILKVIIGSRNLRQGPQPKIESQAEMLKVIKTRIAQYLPIPILIGSGPKKTVSGVSIDIAELAFLRTLNCVNDAVKKYYAPGLHVVIRLEDLTGYQLELTNEVDTISD